MSLFFYESQDLLLSLLALLKKIVASGEKCILISLDASLDDKLWTASQLDFIPHAQIDNAKFLEFHDSIPVLISEQYIETSNRTTIYFDAQSLIDHTSNTNKQFYLFTWENSDFYIDLFKKSDCQKEFYRKTESKWIKIDL